MEISYNKMDIRDCWDVDKVVR